MKQMIIVLVMLMVIMATVLPAIAQPNVEGRQNTAIAATALSALMFGTGNWLPGIIAGGGAAYAWGQSNQARAYRNNYGYGSYGRYGRGSGYNPNYRGTGYNRGYNNSYRGYGR